MELQLRNFRASRGDLAGSGRYRRSLTSISDAGEYLIARRIGVVDALRSWADFGAFAITFRY